MWFAQYKKSINNCKLINNIKKDVLKLMNIIDTLIRLRDDLKEWVTNNVIILNERFAAKSELNNLENRIEEIENIIENNGLILSDERI